LSGVLVQKLIMEMTVLKTETTARHQFGNGLFNLHWYWGASCRCSMRRLPCGNNRFVSNIKLNINVRKN